MTLSHRPRAVCHQRQPCEFKQGSSVERPVSHAEQTGGCGLESRLRLGTGCHGWDRCRARTCRSTHSLLPRGSGSVHVTPPCRRSPSLTRRVASESGQLIRGRWARSRRKGAGAAAALTFGKQKRALGTPRCQPGSSRGDRPRCPLPAGASCQGPARAVADAGLAAGRGWGGQPASGAAPAARALMSPSSPLRPGQDAGRVPDHRRHQHGQFPVRGGLRGPERR